MLSAGHCSSGTWSTLPGLILGQTSEYGNYFPINGNDVQTISAFGGGLGQVWLNGNEVGQVNSTVIPGVGDDITFDGSVSGEVPDNVVTAVDDDVKLSVRGIIYTVTHQVQASNPGLTSIAVGGDSGGPIVQREPNTLDVAAVGIISGNLVVDGVSEPWVGTGELIGAALSASHTYLVFGD
jgi:hypothetical protein